MQLIKQPCLIDRAYYFPPPLQYSKVKVGRDNFEFDDSEDGDGDVGNIHNASRQPQRDRTLALMQSPDEAELFDRLEDSRKMRQARKDEVGKKKGVTRAKEESELVSAGERGWPVGCCW